jgi:peptide deformylase
MREASMSIIPIRIAGDPVLREKARKIKKIDASIQKLIDDMIDTMHAAPGVGLAAPQIGVSLRVVVIETPETEGVLTLINPEIVKSSGDRRVSEGCLSVPGYQAEITRSLQVTVKALDREGKELRLKAVDTLLAQALEHEIGHINGTLYIDHLESHDQLMPTRPSVDDADAEDVEIGGGP